MATLISHNTQLNKFEIVKYQIMNYCFINKVRLGETELTCLALLGECGPILMTDFWKLVVAKGVLKNPIGVNNILLRLHDKKLVVKQNSSKKTVEINPELNIHAEGDIVINLKLYKLEAKKAPGNISINSKETELA